jgi:hypothetical protein
MSERRFKFVSPGVFLKEIDQSQIPDEPVDIGPVVIGRSERGPGMRPVTVSSFSEFVETFGEPHSQESVKDPWRDGSKAGTTYGAYAAKAWLKNNPTLTFVRLLGKQKLNATTAQQAGWESSEALGLFVFASQSNGEHSGTLAAVIHRMDSGVKVKLSGTFLDTSTVGAGNAAAFASLNSATSPTSAEFKILIENEVARASDASVTGSYVFNLNPNSKKFIRNVLNTDPVRTNNDIYDSSATTYKKYFLAESFEHSLDSVSGDSYFGVIAKLASTGSGAEDGKSFKYPSQRSETGWFIAQDLNDNTGSYSAENMQKLFKLRARDAGTWVQNNLKVSIANLRYGRISGSYGAFDVVVRKSTDTDNTPQIVERFSNCNLDPSSTNYIAKKIGDKYVSYDSVKLKNKIIGQYDNRSKYFYVSVKDEVAAGTTNSELLPFGVFGPLRYEHAVFVTADNDFDDVAGNFITPFLDGSGSASGVSQPATGSGGKAFYAGRPLSPATKLRFDFPEVALRQNGSDGGAFEDTDAFWGAYTGKTTANANFADDYKDLIQPRPRALLSDATSEDNQAAETSGLTEFSWVFSLDNISASFTGNKVLASAYGATNRTDGASVTAVGGQSYKTLIDKRLAKFTAAVAGGSDGFDITEKEPMLREGLLETADNSPYQSIQRAIDELTDPEVVSFNLATVPGLKAAGLTKRLVEKCEDRGDSLAIIDIGSAFVPPAERTATQAAAPNSDGTLGNIDNAVQEYIDRQLDSSFGCAYYPWVQALDDRTSKVVYLPPSVVALGVMSKTDSVRGPWFAPAGFNRGGLSDGDAGLPVLNTTERLSSKDRDKLYDAGINPIATFPNEGVVIFGQKTLQVERSALDRINVRRMLIYVKQGISQIASGFLFEPNVSATWDLFKAQAIPFLTEVQTQFGIDEFKLVLDNTTTTPDLIDQNILYAKLFIKPTRAIEFIAVDFFITNSGASFED